MTKTPRTSSYLHKMACQYDRHMPFLKPPRTQARHWGAIQPHDQIAETVRLTPQSPVETGMRPLFQASPARSQQHKVEQPSSRSMGKTVFSARGAQEVTSRSSTSTQPSRFHKPVTLRDSSSVPEIREQPPQVEIQLTPAKSTPMRSLPATEETASGFRKQPSQAEIQLAPAKSMYMDNLPVTKESASGIRKQPSQLEIQLTEEAASQARKEPPQAEIQLTPAKSTHNVVAETNRPTSAATQVHSDRQTRASGREQTARVILRPPSQPQETNALTSADSRRPVDFLGWTNKTSIRESRPAALPQRQEKHAAINIGTIEVHIVPPTPVAPLPPVRSTAVRQRSTPPLSREMMSFIGLRQG